MREWTGHITEEQLNAWTSGVLSAKEERMLFAHIGVCDHCAELLSLHLEKDPAKPPAYLQEEILEKSRQIEIRTARTLHQTSRKMRLFFYSLKVGFALAVSLSALFILPMNGRSEAWRRSRFLEHTGQKVTERLQDKRDQLNTFLENMADWPIFMECEEE